MYATCAALGGTCAWYVTVWYHDGVIFTIHLEHTGIEISAKLSTTLKRIEDTLILSPQVLQ